MKHPLARLSRALDTLLYRPLSVQAERQQALRDNLLADRKQAASKRQAATAQRRTRATVQGEKRNGR